jgi:hypothetical protein
VLAALGLVVSGNLGLGGHLYLHQCLSTHTLNDRGCGVNAKMRHRETKCK